MEEDRDTWRTPKDLFQELNKQYEFNFDCCASIDNTKTYYYASQFEGVKKEDISFRTCWMNPPFSKAKAMAEQWGKDV